MQTKTNNTWSLPVWDKIVIADLTDDTCKNMGTEWNCKGELEIIEKLFKGVTGSQCWESMGN